jgi:hypothetical protein
MRNSKLSVEALTAAFVYGKLRENIGPPRLDKYVPAPRYRSTVRLGAKIRDCPGGHHAWYESNVGPIRKPLGAA